MGDVLRRPRLKGQPPAYWGKPAVRNDRGIAETSASFEARSAPSVLPDLTTSPRALRCVREDSDEASVGEGIGQPLSRSDAVSGAEGNTNRRIIASDGPAWSKNLACAELVARELEDPRLTRHNKRLWYASGRRGAVVDDVRTREVKLRHSDVTDRGHLPTGAIRRDREQSIH